MPIALGVCNIHEHIRTASKQLFRVLHFHFVTPINCVCVCKIYSIRIVSALQCFFFAAHVVDIVVIVFCVVACANMECHIFSFNFFFGPATASPCENVCISCEYVFALLILPTVCTKKWNVYTEISRSIKLLSLFPAFLAEPNFSHEKCILNGFSCLLKKYFQNLFTCINSNSCDTLCHIW